MNGFHRMPDIETWYGDEVYEENCNDDLPMLFSTEVLYKVYDAYKIKTNRKLKNCIIKSQNILLFLSNALLINLLGTCMYEKMSVYVNEFGNNNKRSARVFPKFFEKKERCRPSSLYFTALQTYFNEPKFGKFLNLVMTPGLNDIIFKTHNNIYVWRVKILANESHEMFMTLVNKFDYLALNTTRRELYHLGFKREILTRRNVAADYLYSTHDDESEIDPLQDVFDDHILNRIRSNVWLDPKFPCYEIKKMVATPKTIIELLKIGYVIDVYLESEFENNYQVRTDVSDI